MQLVLINNPIHIVNSFYIHFCFYFIFGCSLLPRKFFHFFYSFFFNVLFSAMWPLRCFLNYFFIIIAMRKMCKSQNIFFIAAVFLKWDEVLCNAVWGSDVIKRNILCCIKHFYKFKLFKLSFIRLQKCAFILLVPPKKIASLIF